MKPLYLLSGMQLVVIVVLLFKLTGLENQVTELEVMVDQAVTATAISSRQSDTDNQFNRVSRQEASPEYSNADYDTETNITLDDIRFVVRNELEETLEDFNLSNRPFQNPKKVLEHLPPSPDRVADINNRLDMFVTDGELSPQEMKAVETELANLNYRDRQKVLQKMAQAMSKANVKFNN